MQITVLACASAVGTMLPPMVIFKGEQLNHEQTKGEVPDTRYGTSPKDGAFCEWLVKLFIKSIPLSKPVILLFDGYSSHYNLEAVKIAAGNEIILFCLRPHTTHAAQPFSVGFFDPLCYNAIISCFSTFYPSLLYPQIYKYYILACVVFYKEEDNPDKSVTKFQFSMLFNKAWIKSIQPSTRGSKRLVSTYTTQMQSIHMALTQQYLRLVVRSPQVTGVWYRTFYNFIQ